MMACQTRFAPLSCFSIVLSWVIVCLLPLQVVADLDLLHASGHELMQSVRDRHQQYPYVYEEQSMILIDRKGNRETRKLRRFSRVEKDLSARFLLVFDSPQEVKGVAVLAEVTASGETSQSIYLPAFGNELIGSGDSFLDADFLGSDFSVENLIGENLDGYEFKRQRDAIIDDVDYFIIDVHKLASHELEEGRLLRRHYLNKQNLFITRTDFFDDLGRLSKRQSQHDLNEVLGGMWRANMMLMVDHQEQHQTLIKINKRVFSVDYVPEEIFTADWLFRNGQQPQEDVESESIENDLDNVNSDEVGNS